MSERSNIDALCCSLQSFRDARIRQRKAQISELYMTTRRTVRELYREYEPEELPIDVNRVTRDIDMERDLTIDAECDAINDDFKMVVGILRTVAERSPELYDKMAKEVGDDRRGWRQVRRRKRTAPSSALPMFVVATISARSQSKIIEKLLDSPEGVTFRDICAQVWPDPTGPQKKALRAFLRFLRHGGHIRSDGGSTSSMKYKPSGSLKAVAKIYAQ